MQDPVAREPAAGRDGTADAGGAPGGVRAEHRAGDQIRQRLFVAVEPR